MNGTNNSYNKKYGVINFRTATHCSYQRFASSYMKSHNLTSSSQSFFSASFLNSFLSLCAQYRYAIVIMTWYDHRWIIIASLPYLFLPFLYHAIFSFLDHISLPLPPFCYEYNFEQDTQEFNRDKIRLLSPHFTFFPSSFVIFFIYSNHT